MRRSEDFQGLSAIQQDIALDIAAYLIEHVGGYHGSETDAVTDSAGMVKELSLGEVKIIDLRTEAAKKKEKHRH